MTTRLLNREFYSKPTIEVARALLGCILEHRGPNGEIRGGRILEVEAYPPYIDAAAHSFHGMTPRTRVIFGPPGHAYVYLCYGMYYCLNIVAEPEGTPGCVLIRGIEGIGDGPGKLTRALGITLEHYGCDLTRGPITVRRGRAPRLIEATPRIGIRKNTDLPLRFMARD
jgi:DNA-3-methyladenine glycosylase